MPGKERGTVSRKLKLIAKKETNLYKISLLFKKLGSMWPFSIEAKTLFPLLGFASW